MPIDIIDEVEDWLGRNKNKVAAAYLTKGGWEGWAQVELALFLHDKFGTNTINIFREDGRPYTQANPASGERSDMYIQSNDGTALGVELKCESLFQQQTANTRIARRLYADMVKVAGIISPPQHTTMYAIGISVTQEGLNDLKELAGAFPTVQHRRVASITDAPVAIAWYSLS
jgi:hypothetical protein